MKPIKWMIAAFAILVAGGAYAQQAFIAVATSPDGYWGSGTANTMEGARQAAIRDCGAAGCDWRSVSERSNWSYVVIGCNGAYMPAGSPQGFARARDVAAEKLGYARFNAGVCYTVAEVSAASFQQASVPYRAIALSTYYWATVSGYGPDLVWSMAIIDCEDGGGESCSVFAEGPASQAFVILRCNGQFTAGVANTYDLAKQRAAENIGLATAKYCTEEDRF